MLQEIQDILLQQKREIEARTKEPYIKRDTTISLNNDLIKVIMGPRRAGKSFYAMHYLKNAGSFGYINFDDEKLIENIKAGLNDFDRFVDEMEAHLASTRE